MAQIVRAQSQEGAHAHGEGQSVSVTWPGACVLCSLAARCLTEESTVAMAPGSSFCSGRYLRSPERCLPQCGRGARHEGWPRADVSEQGGREVSCTCTRAGLNWVRVVAELGTGADGPRAVGGRCDGPKQGLGWTAGACGHRPWVAGRCQLAGVCAVVGLIGVLRGFGWIEMLKSGVSLASKVS